MVSAAFVTCLFCLFVITYGRASSLHYRNQNSSPTLDVAAERSLRDDLPTRCPKVRTLDGTCTNNGRGGGNRLWGSAGTAHFSYVSGTSSKNPVRTSLPSARLISNVIASQSDPLLNRRGITEFFVFFGEFLDHNIIATSITENDHMDISIPDNDPLRSNFTKGFLRFTRAARTRVLDEDAERAMNTISSAIDLSTVYSSSEERLRTLRTFSGGKLQTSAGHFMPFNTAGLHNEPSDSSAFFLAGDIRANDHPVLTSLHTIFLREHNYLCDIVAKRDPGLDDEEIFQTARKINIAQMQKIVFEEFYPAITGRYLPPYRGFQRRVNPGISDIFSTAAYRIGHTLVGNNVQRRGPGMAPLPSLDFSQMFFRPAQMFLQNGMETFLRGAIHTTAQEVDTLVSNSLRNFLFSNVPEFRAFVDLIALNIQRGRDNALPGYNEVRRIFGLLPARHFSDVTSSLTVQSQLSTLYESPEDIDPWIGLMAEDHVPGASMGPTTLRIWEREFVRIRDGDRLFYRNPTSFSGRFARMFPEVLNITSGKRETMKELIVRHTDIEASEIPGSLFRRT